jgi:hypothetical protein
MQCHIDIRKLHLILSIAGKRREERKYSIGPCVTVDVDLHRRDALGLVSSSPSNMSVRFTLLTTLCRFAPFDAQIQEKGSLISAHRMYLPQRPASDDTWKHSTATTKPCTS